MEQVRRSWMNSVAVAALWWPIASCAAPVEIQGSGCDPAHPCPSPLACQAGACVELTGYVVPGCTTDAECVFGVCCEGSCAQCCEAGDCFGAACLEDRSCGCTAGGHCVTGRCNATTSQCLSCYSDTHCESGVCDLLTGICADSSTGQGADS